MRSFSLSLRNLDASTNSGLNLDNDLREKPPGCVVLVYWNLQGILQIDQEGWDPHPNQGNSLYLVVSLGPCVKYYYNWQFSPLLPSLHLLLTT